MTKRPNILYIHSHDSGRYIQPYGHAVETPNLSRLAKEGIMFRKAFTAAPTCSPSRACLLTGQAAHSSGMLGLAHMGWNLNDYKQHLRHILSNEGYKTALCGIQHIAARPAATKDAIGYDETFVDQSRDSCDIGEAAANYLKQDHEQPFFLSVGFWDTHRPFPVPEDNPAQILVPPTLPDTPEIREDMAAYQTSARALDAGIGRVLDALDEAGLADHTLVICTTDHGIPMPKMKCNLTDHGMGVFLIMRGPGGFMGGKVSDAMVSQIDIFPTVCELLEIAHPEWLQGKSMMPLVRGEAEEINKAVFGEVTYHASYEPKRAIRTKRWKYIRRFDHHFKREVLPNCDESASKKYLTDQTEWGCNKPDEVQLYDLLLDPQEMNNLAADAGFKRICEELNTRLHVWMERTDDPLLEGPVRLSACGVVWPQDAAGPIGEPSRPSAIR